MVIDAVSPTTIRETEVVREVAVLHSDDGAGGKAAPLAQARRHLHRARQPWRHRCFRRRTGRPVQRRHPLSRPARTCAGRGAAAAARLESARRQFRIDGRSHQSRCLSQWPDRAAEGHAAHRAHHLSVARHGLSADRRAEPWRPAGEFRPDACCSTTTSPICSKCAAKSVRAAALVPASCSVPPTSLLEYSGLDGRSRAHRAAFRSAADAACGECGDLSPRSGAAAGRFAVRRGILQQAGRHSSRRRSFADCWRIAARCAARPRAPPASKHQTISSTRCCASRWPISTC